MNLNVDYSKLRGKIKEKFVCNLNFAIKMGISERTLSLKLNNIVGWKQSEIFEACDLLNIDYSEIYIYFFKQNVQNIEQINR